ncbi:MAG: acetate kinase [Armatimonadetes bacterium]|nr:acetate kinase [Armatimonadota bacterium]
MIIFVLNSGSSSLKYQLFDMRSEKVLATGLAERVGQPSQVGRLVNRPTGGAEHVLEQPFSGHREALDCVFDLLLEGTLESIDQIDAVGHRVVHGGESFTRSVRLTPEILEELHGLSHLAPLHNPANVTGIRACFERLPSAAQIAVFDTAFHSTMPPVSYMYALPYHLYTDLKVRRYGFHGTSHQYVSARAIDLLGRAAPSRIVTCHLGNGCSMTAVRDGVAVDTSMGMTPAEGLVMGTRCGDIDPAVLTFLMETQGWGPERIDELINKESGLQGLSGESNDMRDLTDLAAQGHERAKLAVDVFCHRVRKYIGAYAAEMGGLDAVVFTGGIGENSSVVRAKCCDGLEFLGVELDDELNQDRVRGERDISRPGSRARIMVIPTNEELVIARETARLAAEALVGG